MGVNDNEEVRHLLDAVRRDAVRTDPGNPFYAVSESHYSSRINLCESSNEDNVQKLINIITIYTLEHKTCAYTQGMTDVLSPILYVMKHEADAYVCFAAMVERIRNHFETWCVGTLLKLERLKHLCEVLDPELFYHLKENVEEDAFALFFGMVLIECRREFSFEDSFHLLEAIWAGVACMKDSLPHTTALSRTQWARYMTHESPDVIQQVMGETQSPYSAVPLPRSESMIDTNSRSRQPSSISQVSAFLRREDSQPLQDQQDQQDLHSGSSAHPTMNRLISRNEVIEEEMERERGSTGESSSLAEVSLSDVPEKRPRSYTDPSPQHSDPSLDQPDPSTRKKGLSDSHSESEVLDSYNSQAPPPPRKPKSSGSSRPVTEMSDMSSLSSNNALVNSFKSFDSRNTGTASAASERSRSPARVVNGRRSLSEEDENDGDVSPNIVVNGEGMGYLREDIVKEKSLSTRSEVSTLVSMDLHDSPVKSPAASTVVNGALSPPSGSSDLSSNYQSALSTLPNSHQEGSPSQSSSNNNYQTANDDSSVTDLQSRSLSQSPSLLPNTGDDEKPTSLVAAVNGDLSGLRPEEVVPVHAWPNGTIIQGTGGEHHKGELLAGASLPFTPVMEEEGGGKRKKLAKQPQTKTKAKATGESRRRTKTEPTRSSPVDIYDEDAVSSSSKVTPVPFFDAIEQLATSAPGSNFLQSGRLHRSFADGQGEEENELELSQANSMILSQLISTDRSAPRVTREKSLELPVSDCFPLFICLSILVQNRAGIMHRNIDFVGLSVLLNAQAGSQDLDVTLQVAKNLYKTYREYQMTYLGSDPEDLDTWLDDDRTSDSEDRDHHPASDESHNNDIYRTSVVSDEVFIP